MLSIEETLFGSHRQPLLFMSPPNAVWHLENWLMNACGALHVNNCKLRITDLHLTAFQGLIQWGLVSERKKEGQVIADFFLLLNALFELAAYFIL